MILKPLSPSSIGTKIAAAFLVLILIIFSIGLISFIHLGSIQGLVSDQVMEKAEARSLSKDIIFRTGYIFSLVEEYLSATEIKRKRAISIIINDEIKTIREDLNQVDSRMLTSDEKESSKTIREVFSRYQEKMGAVLQSHDSEEIPDSHILALSDEYRDLHSTLTTQLLRFDAMETELMYDSWNHAMERISAMKRYVLVLGIMALVVGMILVAAVTRSITRPIESLADTLERYGGGDFSVRADVKSSDEIGFFARRFNVMLELIQAALQQITDIIDFLPDSTFVIDRERRVIAWNRAMAEMTGIKKEEILGKGDYCYALPFYGEARPMLVDLFFEKAPDIREGSGSFSRIGDMIYAESFFAGLNSGRGAYLWGIASPLFNSKGEIIGAIESLRDITERQKSRDAMKESEEKYRSLVDNLNIGVYRNTSDSHGRFLQANPAMAKIFGFDTVEEMMNTPVIELYQDQEDRKAFLEKIRKFGFVKDEPLQLKKKDGTPIWASLSVRVQHDEAGGIKWMDGVLEDITERKRMEDALRDSEEKFRMTSMSAQDAIIIMDNEGRVSCWNTAAEKMLGYAKDEIVGRHLHHTLAPEHYLEDYERGFSQWRETGRGNAVGRLNEFTARGKDGAEIAIELSVASMELGGKWHAIGIIRDVTERKRLESQLLQAQKMEAIGTLAGGIAHDFNNLLMGIQGYVSLMLLETDPAHTHYGRLKLMQDHVMSGANLTRQLLGFARGGKYEVRTINPNDFMEKVATMFGRTKKEISINKRFEQGIWTVDVDPGQIEQVILNLFVNASHAMPGGGYLYLETANVVLDGSYTRPHACDPGRYVRISVADTGVGMDERTKERIFEPFFTTKEMGRGIGLGLATVYGIVKAHRGIISVCSEKGKGSTFDIYLPASKRSVEDQAMPVEELKTGRGTVLLVDDERIIVDVSSELIRALGYEVLTAMNGRDAVETYKARMHEIDLVILDMIMPDMGGGETFDALRAVNSEVRVILSSGYALDGKAREILERGCRAFIHKPFTIHELSQKIRDVLEP